MAGRYPIRCDQGSTLVRSFRVTTQRGRVRDVTDTANPAVRVDRPHGLVMGDEVVIIGVVGADGLNNTTVVPVWVVASVPTATSFTIATDAPGFYEDGGLVATPRPLDGYTARMQVRPDVDSPTILASLTGGDGTAIVAPPGSGVLHLVRITIPATLTAALAADTYRYDVEIEATDGTVERIAEGPFTVRAEVTR